MQKIKAGSCNNQTNKGRNIVTLENIAIVVVVFAIRTNSISIRIHSQSFNNCNKKAIFYVKMER